MTDRTEYFAACTPNSYPHPDGRVEHGYTLNVFRSTDLLTPLETVDLHTWDAFDLVQAEQHLSDLGYAPAPHHLSPSGEKWESAGLGFMVKVVRATAAQPGTSADVHGRPSDPGSVGGMKG